MDDGGLRRSENIEDRRKERFMSLPHAPQMPNVFLSGDMTGLNFRTDFAPVPPKGTVLSNQLGAEQLDTLIRQYFLDRGNSPEDLERSPQLFDLFK
jgi:hypothetical protein